MKFYYYFILFYLLLPISFAAYISEINFLDNEYIEIYSNETLNLINSTIEDENIGFNSINLIQDKNSSFYLIVGTNFLSEINYSDLNCSIYSTGLVGPGKFGLNDYGENLKLNLTNSSQINFTKIQNYSFNINQTLNFVDNNNSKFILNKSICSFPDFKFENIPNNISDLNQINLSQINFTNQIDSCDYKFEILPKENLSISKIEFSFLTNLTNFTINYWVENFEGEIVKNKIETNNKNQKSYTPKDFTNIYLIKANLFFKNCTYNDSKQVVYYSKTNSYLISEFENLIIENISNNELINQTSYIKILNPSDIINNKTNFLEYEIYKANTLKRSVYIYHNKKKLDSFQLGKYEIKIGKIEFNRTEGLNLLKISGLDLEEKIEFNYSIFKNNLTEKIIEKNYFNISNLIIYNNLINFDINTNLENISIDCYILNERTKISKNINLTILEINSSKLNENEIYNLKLLCKYKKENLKTWNSISLNFNYSFFSKNKNIQISNIDFKNSTYIQEEKIYSTSNYQNFLNTNENVIELNKSEIYFSKNKEIKKNSFYLTFIGVTTLLSSLIFLW